MFLPAGLAGHVVSAAVGPGQHRGHTIQVLQEVHHQQAGPDRVEGVAEHQDVLRSGQEDPRRVSVVRDALRGLWGSCVQKLKRCSGQKRG
eukprot:504190-Pleurochrysis_carterae.AAC.1